MREATAEGRFLFVANQACLDFVNTEVMRHGQPADLLEGFGSLAAWLAESGLVPAEDAMEAARRWEGSGKGRHVHAKALELRGRLRAMAEALARGEPVPSSSVEAINEALRWTLGPMEVAAAEDGFELRQRTELQEPEQLLGPIAEQAAELLCGTERALVRRCENPGCILYFLDTSRNRSRRWCSMEACGNRAKVAAHYRRQRDRRG
jgi:predicted RNA-binding Zn ribbon-like protein